VTNTRLSVLLGSDATEIEPFASRELCRYLEALYGERCAVSEEPLPQADYVFHRSMETNPAGHEVLHGLTDQGVLLKNTTFRGTPGLVVGAGSPIAVLWAVYALVEKLGVRFLLHGDLMPERPPPLPLRLHIRSEPVFPIRWWRTINDFACGPESWGIEDHRKLIDQLAKFKFNRILLYLWP